MCKMSYIKLIKETHFVKLKTDTVSKKNINCINVSLIQVFLEI